MTKHHSAIQVRVLWGNNPIHITELYPPRNFSIGEENCDFTVPGEQMGTERLELVTVNEGLVRVAAPADAVVSVHDTAGKSLVVAPHVFGVSTGLALEEGQAVCWTRGSLTFEVSLGVAEARMARAILDDEVRGKVAYFGASLFSVGSLLSAAAFFVPPLGLTSGEGIDPDQLVAMQAYLEAAAERQEEQRPVEAAGAKETGEVSTPAESAPGQAGKPAAQKTEKRASHQGPRDNPEPSVARLQEARTFGIIGFIPGAEGQVGAVWGRDGAFGNEAFETAGNLWGDEIGESFGTHGLQLQGKSQGGGDDFDGIDLGLVRTVGRDGLCEAGKPCAFSGGLTEGGHATKAPKLQPDGQLVLSGRLPSEVVQRLVRQNFGRFRYCYEQGLARNPNLQGRVAVRFMIGRDGAVTSALDSGSSLPDAGVTSCVVNKFYGITFPKPENGSVTVSYPLMFSPG
jgi:hypothetical protein